MVNSSELLTYLTYSKEGNSESTMKPTLGCDNVSFGLVLTKLIHKLFKTLT